MINPNRYFILLSAMVAALLMCRSSHAADLASDPSNDNADAGTLVHQLASDNPVERDKASFALECLPSKDLVQVQAAERRDDLAPEVKSQLHKVLLHLEPRIRLRLKRLALAKVIQEWSEKMNVDFYQRDGHTNPAWDEAVKKVFALDAMRLTVETEAQQAPIAEQEKTQLDSAINAGCDDPGLLTIAGELASDTHMPAAKSTSWFAKAENSAMHGKANPFTRLIIDGRLVRAMMSGATGPVTRQKAEAAAALLSDMTVQYAQARKLPGIPPHLIYVMAENVMRTSIEANVMDIKPIYDGIYPSVEAALPDDSSSLYFKGVFYVQYAREARGNGGAGELTQQARQDFAERLQMASDALSKAYDLDPSNPDPFAEMLTVVMHQNGDRPTMEKWFKRAMTADPDNFRACRSKLSYLDHTSQGDAALMLEFGHQCYDDGNWYTAIPFMLNEAHVKLSRYETDLTYYQRESVWRDFNSVYSRYFELHPDDVAMKSQYCYYASICGQWKTAHQLFEELGDKVVVTEFGSKRNMNDFKQRASDLASDGK